MWEVNTQSDNRTWKFDTINEAIGFYDDVRKYNEVATFPRFIG